MKISSRSQNAGSTGLVLVVVLGALAVLVTVGVLILRNAKITITMGPGGMAVAAAPRQNVVAPKPDDTAAIDALIAQYAATHDKDAGLKLGKLLDDQKVSKEVGAKILNAIWKDNLVVRKSYAVGKAPILCIKSPEVKAGSGYSWRSGDALLDGQPCRTTRVTMTTRGVTVHKLDWIPDRPGMHKLVYPHECRLMDSKGGDTYEANIDFTADLNIVEPEKAEQVKFVSGKEIDRKMKASLVFSNASPLFSYASSTQNGVKRTIRGGASIDCKEPPVSYVCRMVFRDRKGNERPFDGCEVALAGERNTINVPIGSLKGLEPGSYRGTLVLTADKDAAQGNPMIESAWEGSLEFPMTFEFEVEKVKGE